MKETIGLVGVGRMGANMARRLVERGHRVTVVYDAHRPSATLIAQELGAESSSTLAGVTALADVIITVVTDDRAMREIFANNGDNLLIGAAGKLFINCATVSPAVHHETESLAAKAGAQSLEACMASSITQARQGSLYLMCGGREENFRRAEPIQRLVDPECRFAVTMMGGIYAEVAARVASDPGRTLHQRLTLSKGAKIRSILVRLLDRRFVRQQKKK